MLVGRISDTDNSHTLLAYDISSIGPGATITSITLTLTKRSADSGVSEDHTITVHELVGTFLESLTNGPSWNNRDQGAMTPWTTPGGDFNPTILSSVTANPKTTVAGIKFVFPSSTEFVSAAQNALDGSGTIYMLLRSPDSEADNDRGLFQFWTDDGASKGVPPGDAAFDIPDYPLLTVEYSQVPEPTSVALLTLAAIGILLSGCRRRFC